MFNKKKKKHESLPEGFTAADIKIESSICNGEKTIGFYSASEKKLYFAELLSGDDDIQRFYDKYGLER